MKTILGFAALVALTAGAALSVAQPPQPEKPKPEPLPEFPVLGKDSKLVPNPAVKDIVMEVKDKKIVRAGIVCEVCLREGPLEQFLCKKGTKEHEAILRADMDALFIHQAIELAGGKSGTPTGFLDAKMEEAKYTAATGSKVTVTVHYTLNGKTHTHPAQEWIWDTKRKAPIQHGWVFAGSKLIPNPNDPKAKPFYGANSGDIFSISNFPYSTLEMPVQISKDEAQLTYEAKTEKIPPLGSKVWVILEVVPEKK